jgi:hypothetical protein
MSLLGDDVTPGWATRVGQHKATLNRAILTAVWYGERPSETVVESVTRNCYALQAISLWGDDFLPVDLLPVDLNEMAARSCRTAAIATIEDG